jgi:hypothetical protein
MQRLARRLVRRRRPIRALAIQSGLVGKPLHLPDIRPFDVIGAQSIGPAVPARWRRRQLHRRRLAGADPHQALRRLGLGRTRVLPEPEQCRDLRIAGLGQHAGIPSQRRRGVAHRGDRVATVVLAVAKRPHAVLPGFAPGDAREPDEESGQLDRLVPFAATLERVIAAHIVMDPSRDARHVPRHEVALGGVEIAARGIAAQRPRSPAMGLPGRQPERHLEQGRDRIEVDRVRIRHAAAAQRPVARVEPVREQRQLGSRGAFIEAKRVRLVGPVEATGPRRVPVRMVLAALVVVRQRVGGHGG